MIKNQRQQLSYFWPTIFFTWKLSQPLDRRTELLLLFKLKKKCNSLEENQCIFHLKFIFSCFFSYIPFKMNVFCPCLAAMFTKSVYLFINFNRDKVCFFIEKTTTTHDVADNSCHGGFLN